MPRSRTDPLALLAVALGGCIGGPLRYAAGEAFPDRPGEFPWTTFAVNVLGAALLGLLLAVVLGGAWARPYAREFLGVGVLGSFTTFSTWMLQTHGLVEDDRPGLATAYVGTSLVAGLVAGVAGIVLGRTMIERTRRS